MDWKQIERIIRTAMRQRSTPGMALSVIQDGKTVYSRGFGARDLKKGLPMDADTLVGIGSVTKSFAAFAILQLQDAGKLSIEDSAAQHLDFEPFSSRPQIKLKHLLSHSSGIPSLDAGMLGFTYTFDDFSRVYPATSREDFIAHLADASEFIRFEPGEKFFYNNDMYTCLGFVVEATAGMPFDKYIQDHVFKPLGMKRSVFSREALNADADNNIMSGYLFDMQGNKRVVKTSEVPMDGYLQAPGGIYTSANEMLNYAQCLLEGGTLDGKKLLSADAASQLFNPLITTPYGEVDEPGYALGWSVEAPSKAVPHQVIHHGGGMGTSSSFLLLVPELKLGIMAAENASSGVTPIIARAVLAAAMGQDPETAVEELRLNKVLREIEGTYKSQYGMYQLKVGPKGGVLQADLETDDGAFSFPLLPKDLDQLVFKVYSLKSNSKSEVAFYRDEATGRPEFASYDRFLYRRS